MADPLTESLQELRDATDQRAHAVLLGVELEKLDEKVCLAGRKVFVRYVDAAGVFERPDERTTQTCLQALEQARASVESSTTPVDQYPGAHRYLNSVREKAEMLGKMAAGMSVRTVLRDKVVSLFGDAVCEVVH